jgi:hypothetical protein
MSGKFRKLSLSITAIACSVGVLAVPAQGAVTVGQIAPTPPGNCSGAQEDIVQVQTTIGNPYVIPVDGTITSYRTLQGASDPGVAWKLKTFRPTGAPDEFEVTAADQPRVLTPNTLNTFATDIPVTAGDMLGLNRAVGGSGCTITGALGGTTKSLFPGDLAVGASATFFAESTRRLNIEATVEPLNTFTFGAVTRNKKKGTARLAVTVPNAGELTVGGKGVKAATVEVAEEGEVTVPIRSKGKKKKALKNKGKVKVAPKITFTPTDGEARTETRKLKLKRN